MSNNLTCTTVLDSMIVNIVSSIFDDVGEYTFDPKAALAKGSTLPNYFDKSSTAPDEVCCYVMRWTSILLCVSMLG